MPPSLRRAAVPIGFVVLALATACGPSKLDAQHCRDDYLHLPGRERLEREPGSQEARDQAAAEMQQWVIDHPECRP